MAALMTEEIGRCREVTVMADITPSLGSNERFYFSNMLFGSMSVIRGKPNRNCHLISVKQWVLR